MKIKPFINITSNCYLLIITNLISLRRDSNPRPAGYKPAALPTELLRRHLNGDIFCLKAFLFLLVSLPIAL